MGNITNVSCKWFKWVEQISQFNEDFIKSYYEESDEGCFLEVSWKVTWTS